MSLFLEFRPFRSRLFWAAAVFAEAFQVHPFCESYQQVCHLMFRAIAKLPLPMLVRDRHHHPPHHSPDFIRQVVGGDVIETFLAVSGRYGSTYHAQDVIGDQAEDRRGQRSGSPAYTDQAIVEPIPIIPPL